MDDVKNNSPRPQGETQAERLAAQDRKLLQILCEYIGEAEANAEEWQDRAEDAWDMIHGRIDWSHKEDDETKLHMNRVGLAHEQIKAQIKKGLMNFDKWLVCDVEEGTQELDDLINTDNARRMVLRAIRLNDPKATLTDNIGSSVVENILATKLLPNFKIRRGPGGKEIKEFYVEHIKLDIRSYLPDALCSGLYSIYKCNMDHHKIMAMASDDGKDKSKPFIKDHVKHLAMQVRDDQQETEEAKGNDLSQMRMARRRTHVLYEVWGTILDDNGDVFEYEFDDGSKMSLDDVVIVVANKEAVVTRPKKFPSWDGAPDIIAMQVLRTAENAHGRGLLIPGVDMNRAEDELISAGVDAAKKEAYNVNILKYAGLMNKKQASGGIKPNTTFIQNNSLAPGEKLLETATTGKVPSGLLNILGVVRSAGAENMRLNEVSLSGDLPDKQVRATELVRAENTIQGLFDSIVGDIEDIYVETYARKVFLMVLQYKKHLNDADLRYIFYNNEEKIERFKQASATELYDEYSSVFRFRGKGIRSLMENQAQASTLVNILNMIVSNPIVLQSFEQQGFNVNKVLEKIMRGVGIDMEEISDELTAMFAKVRQLQREKTLLEMQAQGQGQQNAPQQGQQNVPQTQAPNGMVPGNGQQGQ